MFEESRLEEEIPGGETDCGSISSILTSHREESVQFLIYEGFRKDTVKLLLPGLPVKMVFLSTPPPHISLFEKGIVGGHESVHGCSLPRKGLCQLVKMQVLENPQAYLCAFPQHKISEVQC